MYKFVCACAFVAVLAVGFVLGALIAEGNGTGEWIFRLISTWPGGFFASVITGVITGMWVSIVSNRLQVFESAREGAIHGIRTAFIRKSLMLPRRIYFKQRPTQRESVLISNLKGSGMLLQSRGFRELADFMVYIAHESVNQGYDRAYRLDSKHADDFEELYYDWELKLHSVKPPLRTYLPFRM